MSTHSLFGWRKKHAHALRAADKKSPALGSARPDARQPFSDGSEEFFEEFTRREEGWYPRRPGGFFMSLGLALGLFFGAGAIMYFYYHKAKPAKRRRWLEW